MIGKIISHYRILSELGSGGMGVVYRAEDLSLGRNVALKFLPAHLSSDPEARRRLVHEAKAAAALDHSGICTVYDSGEADGRLFIAMALLEGMTLKDRIAEGPLPISQALDLAIQVADALEEAHSKGVTHRDIKPANIMITPKGQAKVMDFGLAQVAGATHLTQSGSTMGTAAYMSPEQARGERVDQRTDIWSLGVVLYEMVAGRRPFNDSHLAALVYAIQQVTPPALTGLRTDVPLAVDRIANKCLAKVATDRYRHADEVAVDLRRVRSEVDATRQFPARPPRSRPRAAWAAISAGAIILGLVTVLFVPRLARSPAGSRVLDADGVVMQLTFTGDAGLPLWSPDGRAIAFGRRGGIYIMPADGGQARKVDSPRSGLMPWGWTNDGKGILAHGVAPGMNRVDVVRVDVYGGQERVLAEGASQAALSPDGRTLAFSSAGLDSVCLMDLATGEIIAIARKDAVDSKVFKPQWLPDGNRIIYSRESRGPGQELWMISRDGSGKRQIPTYGIALGGHYCVTSDGESVLMAGELGRVWSIWKLSLNGEEPIRMTEGTERDYHVSAAPDGRSFVFGRATDASTVILVNVQNGDVTSPVKLSIGAHRLSFAAQGTELYFEVLVGGRWQVWKTDTRRAGSEVAFLTDAEASLFTLAAGAGGFYYLRSPYGLRSTFGLPRSQTLWKCAADGGRARQISPDSLSVLDVAPSRASPEQLLYTGVRVNEADRKTLFLLTEQNGVRELARDSDTEQIQGFAWGSEEDKVLLLLAQLATGSEHSVIISMDVGSGERRAILHDSELQRLLGFDSPVGITSFAPAPDRKRLAMVLARADTSGGLAYEIVAHDLSAGTCRRLHSCAPGEAAGYLTWSADGTTLGAEIQRGRADLFLWKAPPQ